MNATPRGRKTPAEITEYRIRERAHALWLKGGCPDGADWEHWFEAKRQLLAEDGSSKPGGPPPLTIRSTLAKRLSDPAHRFHAPGIARDHRLDVIEGEARQRVRGRHFDGSLRAEPKKPA